MLKPTRKQLNERWDILPQILKDALFSEEKADRLWKVCENEHIPQEKINIIAILTGDVILGFLRFDDLDEAIRDDVGLDYKLAQQLAETINKKIFFNIKDEINKNYSPLEKGDGPKTTSTEEEIVDLRIKPTTKGELSPDEEKPLIIHQETQLKPTITKSLGGLFNFIKKKSLEETESGKSAVTAQVEIPGISKSENFIKQETPSVLTRQSIPSIDLSSIKAPVASKISSAPLEEKSFGSAGPEKIKIVHYNEASLASAPSASATIVSREANIRSSVEALVQKKAKKTQDESKIIEPPQILENVIIGGKTPLSELKSEMLMKKTTAFEKKPEMIFEINQEQKQEIKHQEVKPEPQKTEGGDIIDLREL